MNEVAGTAAKGAKVIQLPTDPSARRRRVSTELDTVGSGAIAFITPRIHEANPPATIGEAVRRSVAGKVSGAANFLRKRMTGDYTVDDFGFDTQFLESIFLPVLRPVFDRWFRVDVTGTEHLPANGAALIVANHAGVLPLDALMASVAVHDHSNGRPLRLLAADLVFDLPFIGSVARRAGHTLACGSDADRLLRDGEIVGVFPEGFKGIGKPFSDRYKLQRFGRGGFVSAAIKSGAPIIPCSIVGSEEIYPKIGDLPLLARLLGLPYFPVTPLFPLLGPLGMIPLPTKWHIEFGEPIYTNSYDPADSDDPVATFELTDTVRERIQLSLYRQLAKRRSVFLG